MPLKVPPLEEDFRWCKRVFLRWKGSEWSSSVFSVKISFEGSEYIGPNRDSPYEGLTSLNKGKPWKFLDGIFFKAENPKALDLEVSPLKVTYNYKDDKGPFSIDLELLSKGETFFLILRSNRTLELLPFLDIRHIYGKPIHEYQVLENYIDGKLFLLIKGREAQIILGPLKNYSKINFLLNWYYKYGDGFRRLNGKPRFIGINQDIFSPILATVEGEFYFSNYTEKDFYFTLKYLWHMKRDHLRKIKENFLTDRLIALESFGIPFDKHELPEAGGWWFKNVWFRDLLEGIRWNFLTYVKLLDKSHWLKDTLYYLAELLIKRGILPNLVNPVTGELESFSTDATLSFLNLWCEGVKYLDLPKEMLELLLKRFRKNDYPKFSEEGFIWTKAFDSWVDSFKFIEGIGKFPSRVPISWAKELGPDKATDSLYLLPELNSLWLRVLSKAEELGIKLDIKLENFMDTFWSNDFIVNLVNERGERDETVTSMGLEALVNLEDILDEKYFLRAWKVVKDKLLVYRKGKPFCVKTKDSKETVYLDDNQYHEGTVWLRNLPYLLKLALKVKEYDFAKNILLNLLDHSLGEGALFYNQELFSLDDGDLVPVKNPVQYWSHFTDPFIWKELNTPDNLT